MKDKNMNKLNRKRELVFGANIIWLAKNIIEHSVIFVVSQNIGMSGILIVSCK